MTYFMQIMENRKNMHKRRRVLMYLDGSRGWLW